MSNCNTCGNEHLRLLANSKSIPARYCSTECIKRASYLRRNPNKRSLGRTEKFWETETGIGFKWEKYVAEKLKGEHRPFNKQGIDVCTSIGNIDVKVCNKYGPQWVFNKNKPKPIIDWYYCICLENSKPVKELLIPRADFKGRGITVGTVSPKYDIYKV